VPAAAAWVLRSREHVPARPPWLVRMAERVYAPVLDFALRRGRGVMAPRRRGPGRRGPWCFSRLGTAFVPQLDEGDLVVQTTRAPDISLETAASMTPSAMERLLRGFPRCVRW
jgi:cobalt-zinc-cadmium resistance protein CzcA